MISVLTPLPVLLPLLGAAVALLVGGRHPMTQRVLSILVLSAVLVVSVALLVLADADGAAAVSVGGWPVPLGIVLVVDRLSALMLVVAATVALGVLIFAVGQGAADGDEETPISIFHPTFLVLIAGVANAFLAGDLFNLYVGFEILLTASYVLLTLGGSAPRIRAGITYIVVSLLSSILFLAAIALVYAATGTVNMAQLAVRLQELPDGTQLLLQAMLLIAFCIKAAVFPLSAWLPDSYPTAPAPVTAVFAGLLTKVGVYAVIRTQTLLFPGDAFDDVLMWAALATMVIGILGAVAQTDIRRILSFTLVSHIGYMIFGISLASQAGLAGAIFYVVHHIAIQTTLFLVAGLVERQGGSTSVDRLGGLAVGSPLLAILYFVPAMNLAGIPPFSGFIGKLGLLEAGIADGGWLPVVLVGGGAVTSLLTLLAMSRVWNRAFWRPPTQAPEDDTDDAAAADAGPEIVPAAVAADAPGAAGTDADGGETDGSADAGPGPGGSSASSARGGRQAARQAAWKRHTAVATASTPATDGLGDEPEGGRERPLQPLPRVMVGATAAMVVVTVGLTAVAGPLYAVADRAAGDLLDRTPYMSAVFGEEDVE
ncbi:multisubunit sodium/proton antiporter, MrpD subunit (TC 2.A.63.1) [Blastococcus aurantiacus]|uniref:Multisubunit sodium/proton antiporter, MrpD subunit (TC 2.A.63.1) n=1 Tax=Blastococcus aurantiacus TaxID=1550231 RepID=A0A1G7MLW7_9ACTN|nr:Na+/H+ antiporter subunit D [Blastococcus aurantiacus]SDF62775.1 multisubunit sodium/proton antiporter, MrpD subunit (TC 2.A.63.1) [Blastococcus aurantiacus]